jgi:hypothetical protein
MPLETKSPDGGELLSRLSHVGAIAYNTPCHGSHRKASEMPRGSLPQTRQLSIEKKCSKCGKWKLFSAFGDLNGKGRAVDGKSGVCRQCRNSDAGVAYHRNPERTRAHRLRAFYNMTPADYQALVEKQHGFCAICLEKPTHRKLDGDHDHATGAVRGLLCNKFNGGMGLLRDSPEILAAAIEYLQRAGHP